MSTTSQNAKELMSLFSDQKSFEEVLSSVSVKDPASFSQPPNLPGTLKWSEQAKMERIDFLEKQFNVGLDHLSGRQNLPPADHYKGSIENFIGMTQVPTGLVGPLFINGTYAQGDFYVPMATSEGALIASYSRGARATRLSGGITAVCTTEAVQRTPVWKFESIVEVGQFINWLLPQIEELKRIVSISSRYAKLQELRLNMEGNQLLTVFEYTCGDAAGQNMVTICTQAVCQYIIQYTPVKPIHWFIESNYSGDKKATAVSFSSVRGKKVTCEAVIPKDIVTKVLNATSASIATYWQSSVVAQSQSGSIGLQGHYANGLAALFLACGQDVACVSEAYVGITRMEVNAREDLYVAITLPSLIVGTVGGGTSLPTQQECLLILGCKGPGSARKFAEICGATALCGELSIAAALASGDFTKAHRLFRKKATQ